MSKFYGIEAAPGKETKPVFATPSEIFHLSVIAIPAGAQGNATLYATLDGSTFAIATVDSTRKINQVAVDMILPASQKPVLTVKGNVKLHLSGYVDDMNDAGAPADDEDFSEDGDSEEDSESDEELPVEKATKALEAKTTKAAAAAPVEESDDEEDLDGMDLDEEDLDGLFGEEDEEDLDFDDEELDFSSEEDESEDEEVAAPPATKGRVEGGKPTGKPAAAAGKPQQGARQTGQKYGRV